MKTKLKQFRVEAGLTQAQLATKVGVTQPNYQRWESGSAPVPEEKLKKLSKVLKATPEALLGRHPPKKVSLYDNSDGDDLDYYGEVAIHFGGGGTPLLLSISEAAFGRLYLDLQSNPWFCTVESLANQTVAIRTDAITDLYFSSEAYDDFGPEDDRYTEHLSLLIPDARDWEIIEALEDGIDLDDFASADVERVRQMIMITDEEYTKLVANGSIEMEDFETEKNKNQEETDKIFKLASDTTYQLSTGQRRSVFVDRDRNLYTAFSEFIDFEGGDRDDNMMLLEAEGRHRIIFINKAALDYISIPTHRYEAGRIEVVAADLDSSGEMRFDD